MEGVVQKNKSQTCRQPLREKCTQHESGMVLETSRTRTLFTARVRYSFRDIQNTYTVHSKSLSGVVFTDIQNTYTVHTQESQWCSFRDIQNTYTVHSKSLSGVVLQTYRTRTLFTARVWCSFTDIQNTCTVHSKSLSGVVLPDIQNTYTVHSKGLV